VKQSELLSFYRQEVRRSKRWRSDEGYDNDWKRYIDLYRGKQYDAPSPHAPNSGDRLMVNLIFSTINVMAPSVAVNNPRFVVNARKPETAPQAIVVEEVLNYLWRQNRCQDEFRLGVNDNLVVGHGWLKCGYKFVKPPEEKKVDGVDTDPNEDGGDVGIDDREPIVGNVESEMYVYEDRPFVERISIFDMYVDPDSRHPKEMCWIAQRIWRPIQDVRVDSRYSPSARKKASAKSWSRWTSGDGNGDGRDDKPQKGPKSWCEVIEFYDIKRRTVSTFSLDGDDVENDDSGFLIKPQPMPYAMGHPFEMLRNYEVADNFYPIGDVQQIEPLQLELNKTRTQMMQHRARFQRKWLYMKDAFDRDGLTALTSDIDNTMIPVMSDKIGDTIMPMPAVITPTDFYDQSGLITNDIDRVSGVSDYQRGSAQTSVKRTATEAAMIQDSANARSQDRLARIELSLARLGERIIGLMQQYMTGEQVARIVTMPGRAWVPYDADYIQGEFDYEVAAGSTEPMNETFRRQSALQLVDASMPFLEMGVANPYGLYMNILQKGFGEKNVQQYILQPPQGAPVEEGAPPPPGGGPPPGQEGMPPEQGMPPQQGMPPDPTGQLSQPTQGPAPMDPGSEIPPELLMQMMGSNGAIQ
jgi:hypothetical protein